MRFARILKGRTGAVVLLLAGLVQDAFAQVTPPSRLGERGPERTRPPLPEFRPEAEPEFELPRVPAPPEREPPLSAGIRVFVREIRLTGNTVFTDAELAEVTGAYTGRGVTTEELLELRDALTRYYVDRGYINSGAVIPDQVVEEGVVEIRIVEGTLDEIDVQGLDTLRPSFVEDRLRLGAGPPLNVENLRERIQLLLADPAVDRLDARLGPGARPGTSRLEIEVDETPPYQSEARVANDRAPSVGAERGSAIFRFGNILGYSDPLTVELGFSAGLRDVAVDYSVPLTARDLRFFAAAELTDSNVVEDPFNQIDVESKTAEALVGLSWPVIRTLDDEVRLDLSLERSRSTTFLLGRRFSFSQGVENGRSDVTTINVAQQWQRRTQDQVIALRSTERIGIDALGATANSNLPDGRFFTWLGQVQYARRLNDDDWQVNLRTDVQLTTDPLLPIERIAIGGVDTVRGYRENRLVRDNGWNASAELRIPIARLEVPGISTEPEDGRVLLAPFVDAGGGWNNDAETPDPDAIYGIGTGLRWQASERLFARLDYGIPLNDIDEPEDQDLQDLGLYFELRVLLY